MSGPPSGPIEPESLFDGLSGGAIAVGAFVDLGASVVVTLLLMAAVSPDALSEDPAAAAEAMEAFYASPLAALELVLGLLCTVLGAFVGARRAGRLHVRHGGWIAVASTALIAALAVFALSLEPGDPAASASPPFWYEVLGWMLILPAGVAGGALARAVEGEDR